jgi:hypothetical protein
MFLIDGPLLYDQIRYDEMGTARSTQGGDQI